MTSTYNSTHLNVKLLPDWLKSHGKAMCKLLGAKKPWWNDYLHSSALGAEGDINVLYPDPVLNKYLIRNMSHKQNKDKTWSNLVALVVKTHLPINEEDIRDGDSIHWRSKWQPTPVVLTGVRSITNSRTWLKRLSTHACMQLIQSRDNESIQVKRRISSLKGTKKKPLETERVILYRYLNQGQVVQVLSWISEAS